MTNKKQIAGEVGQLSGFEMLLQTYAEVAATRMQRVRNSVLANRDFLADLNKIFTEVRLAYDKEIKEAVNRQRGNRRLLTVVPHNGKTTCVFLSASAGLYGDIVRRTFQLFAENLRKTKSDATVIGKIGQVLYRGANLKAPLTYFDLPDERTTPGDLKKIVDHIINYEKVVVYYGKFDSVVTQTPTAMTIAGEQIVSSEGAKIPAIIDPRPGTKYIFEPSIEEVMAFFETEIFTSLFIQSVQESQLAKYASRMVYLDGATERVREKLNKYFLEERRLRHYEINQKQVNMMSGMKLWTR